MKNISPELLAKLLGEKFSPTEQQSKVISFNSGSLLVVAGAGAGKTATMASRVAWLVANGIAKPNEVLGLTFTRKATRQLQNKIDDALGKIGQYFNELPIGGSEANIDPRYLTDLSPTISTYDSYAQRLVRDYGMLLSFDPASRIINDLELYQRLKKFIHNVQLSNVFEDQKETEILKRFSNFKNNIEKYLLTSEEVSRESLKVVQDIKNIPPAPTGNPSSKLLDEIEKTQNIRVELLGHIDDFNKELSDDSVTTFSIQTSLAAHLATEVAAVGEAERKKYKVVMLDEYQDTSYAHRVLLSYLFGRGADTSVTAVGDPMQSIYGWNGAAADNLVQFLTDFPHRSLADPALLEPAQKLELTKSWRNPPEILGPANMVSSEILGQSDDRFVSELTANELSDPGEVSFRYFARRQGEVDWVADTLATKYREYLSSGSSEFSAAVLVRENVQAQPFAQALMDRGVPCEVVGLKNLLGYPEIADVVNIARIVVAEQSDASLLSILTRPVVGLGLSDIEKLNRLASGGLLDWKKQNTQELSHDIPIGGKVENLFKEVNSIPTSLSEALTMVSSQTGLSAEGLLRLKRLERKLSLLRKLSSQHSPSQFFIDIISIFGIREEILSQKDAEKARFGISQLDQLLSEVERYSQLPGTTLKDVVSYLCVPDEIRHNGRGFSAELESGEVEPASGRVQILTVHKAKGLEWDTVAVVVANDRTYGFPKEERPYKAKRPPSWLKTVDMIPTQLLDKQLPSIPGLKSVDVNFPLKKQPIFRASTIGTLNGSNLKKAHEKFQDSILDVEYEESIRLFYVAITRARKCLLVSGSAEGNSKAGNRPYLPFRKLHDQFPEFVEQWDLDDLRDEEDISVASSNPFDAVEYALKQEEERQPEAADRWYPRLVVEDSQRVGAQMVKEALESLQVSDETADVSGSFQPGDESADRPEDSGPSLPHDLWEQEVNALLEERKRNTSPEIEVSLPDVLTTSDMVRLKRDPQRFARNLVRPVPFEPSDNARIRGTDFHEWVERHFGVSPTLDIDDPDLDGQDPAEHPDLERLKENFLKSPWADRKPVVVEQPFNLRLGKWLIKGKIDAVFKEPDGSWIILDWKTGEELKPGSEKMKAAQIQLAVYKLAWEQYCRQAGEEDPQVQAQFFYVVTSNAVAPQLPTQDELSDLLGGTSDR